MAWARWTLWHDRERKFERHRPLHQSYGNPGALILLFHLQMLNWKAETVKDLCGGRLHQYKHKLHLIVDNCKKSHRFFVVQPCSKALWMAVRCDNWDGGCCVSETPGENQHMRSRLPLLGRTRNLSPGTCAQLSRFWSHRQRLPQHMLTVYALPSFSCVKHLITIFPPFSQDTSVYAESNAYFLFN